MTFLSPIAKDITLVLQYIDRYEQAIEDVEPYFTLESRKVAEVCATVPRKTAQFRTYGAELKSIASLLELRRDEIEGRRWKAYNEGNNKQLTSKDIQQYIKGDAEYVNTSELLLEIEFLRNKINAIIDALDTLHWQLNNIVKLQIASLEQAVID